MSRGTKKFIVTMSDEKTAPVIAKDARQAVTRIKRWLERKGSDVRVTAINEVR
jgi:hypothetical protein